MKTITAIVLILSLGLIGVTSASASTLKSDSAKYVRASSAAHKKFSDWVQENAEPGGGPWPGYAAKNRSASCLKGVLQGKPNREKTADGRLLLTVAYIEARAEIAAQAPEAVAQARAELKKGIAAVKTPKLRAGLQARLNELNLASQAKRVNICRVTSDWKKNRYRSARSQITKQIRSAELSSQLSKYKSITSRISVANKTARRSLGIDAYDFDNFAHYWGFSVMGNPLFNGFILPYQITF